MATPDDKEILDRVLKRFDSADKGVHKRFRDNASHFYALYRQYTDWKENGLTDRRDRDQGLRWAQREWGAELFIPYAFSTVETILPRMLSRAPTVIVRPRRQSYEKAAPAMKRIIDSQIEAMDYEFGLQKTVRNGLIYGLGVQKTYWAFRTRDGQKFQHNLKGEWVSVPNKQTLWNDPLIENVDPFNFLWDPFAEDMQNAEWVIHRTWRSPDYVKKLIDSEVWTGVTATDITNAAAGSEKYTEVQGKRLKADGYPNFKAPEVHEVWEYHDGSQVVTILDRRWVVQQGPNPTCHGELPFQVFRPTPVDGRLVGIGEIEPIVDLQAEINTLRSQRRDNATLVLQKSFFYADGYIDPADFKVGPGVGIPVMGDPREAIFPVQIGEIPNSGYQEEARLQSDIERTTGIDDSLSGSGNTAQTATGIQLVQAAASQRIQQKTRNAEIELVRNAGRQMVYLNQQHISQAREIRLPMPPMPGQPENHWAWETVTPEDLQGEFDIDIEGGSMAPENVPQQRQDAQLALQLMGNPAFNPQFLARFVAHNMGADDSEMWVQHEAPPPLDANQASAVFDLLAKSGVNPDLIKQAIAAAKTPVEPQKP